MTSITERAIEIAQKMQRDIEADVTRYDGMAVNGLNVSTALGEIAATVHGLAGVVAQLAHEVAELRTVASDDPTFLGTDLVEEGIGAPMTEPEPPHARYRLTLTIDGNTLGEVEEELWAQANGGFLSDSATYMRNSWRVVGSHRTSVMEERNPQMTPGRYKTELAAWFKARKESRAAETLPSPPG